MFSQFARVICIYYILHNIENVQSICLSLMLRIHRIADYEAKVLPNFDENITETGKSGDGVTVSRTFEIAFILTI